MLLELSGTDPASVSIDRTGSQAYVTDTGAHVVRVLTYPDGSNVATLGKPNGLEIPTAAVVSGNYVP